MLRNKQVIIYCLRSLLYSFSISQFCRRALAWCLQYQVTAYACDRYSVRSSDSNIGQANLLTWVKIRNKKRSRQELLGSGACPLDG